MSFGNKTLGRYILLLLRQYCPPDFRKEAYSNERFLSICTFETSAMVSPLETIAGMRWSKILNFDYVVPFPQFSQ